MVSNAPSLRRQYARDPQPEYRHAVCIEQARLLNQLGPLLDDLGRLRHQALPQRARAFVG